MASVDGWRRLSWWRFSGGDTAESKTQGLPQPAAAVLLSPWLDLALTGGSMQSNADRDVMLGAQVLGRWAQIYLGERDPLAPLASPLFGIARTSRLY